MEKNPCGFLDVKYISDYHLFQIRQQILECAVCTVTFVQRYRFHQSVKIVMSDIILVLGGGGRFLSEHQKIQWRIKNSCDIGKSIYTHTFVSMFQLIHIMRRHFYFLGKLFLSEIMSLSHISYPQSQVKDIYHNNLHLAETISISYILCK